MVPHKSSLRVDPLEMIVTNFNNKYGQRHADTPNPILNDSDKYIIIQ